jgi:hypothetical protein
LIAALSAHNKATAIITHWLLLAMVVVLGGCASSHATAGLDQEAHGINCSGADRTWALCGERAAEICGARGYDVLAAGGGTAGMLETLNPSAGFDGPVTERSILIRCR